MKTAVLFVRTSTQDQYERGFSPESQKKILQEAAKNHDVVRTFSLAESAKISERRKQFHEMVQFVKENMVDAIFALSHDRLARHYKDFATLQSLIDDNGVSIVLVESNKTVSKDSPISDRFLFQILAALAEADNRKRSADTKRGMAQAASTGNVPHLVPNGYLNVGDEKTRSVIVDEKRAPLIKWAFEAYAEGGWSLTKMAAELNARGLTFKPSAKRPERPITDGNLYKTLTNRFYAGEFKSGGTWHKGNYQTLVSGEVWQKVQSRLNDNLTASHPETKKFFAFRPYLKCGFCHCSLTAAEMPGRHGKGHFRYYFCTSGKRRVDADWYKKKFGTVRCPQRHWKEAEIDEAIKKEIGKLYLDDVIVGEVKKQLKETDERQDKYERRELLRLEKERTRKRTHLKLSYRDRLDGMLSVADYSEIQTGIQNDLDRIEQDIKKLSQQNLKAREQGSQVIELLNGVAKIYAKADMETKHEILGVLLERVVARGNDLFITFKEPFDTLFDLGQMFKDKGKWGE